MNLTTLPIVDPQVRNPVGQTFFGQIHKPVIYRTRTKFVTNILQTKKLVQDGNLVLEWVHNTQTAIYFDSPIPHVP